jgi:HAD superfamily hydrolase (TIGR01509 family)
MIKAIVLDIGGVLVRTEDRTFRDKLEEQYNLQIGESDKLVFESKAAQASTIGKAERNEIWEHVANELSLSKEELGEFQTQFWAGDKLDQEIVRFLHDLSSFYITALLSNAWLGHRRTLDEEFDIIEGQTADVILLSSELGVSKPDPRIYAILADTTNCIYNEILFVDDFIENIEAAKALGIHTIHYQPGMNLINAIKSRLDKN